MKRVTWLYSGVAVFGLFFCAAAFCVGGEDAQMRILELARSGQDAEAIESFEGLPDRDEADIAVLRAAAGCYWRERRFEEARVIYRRILERQSNINALDNGDEPRALLGRERSAAAVGPEAVVAEGVTPAAVPAERAVTVPAPAVQEKGTADPLAQELETLKVRYQTLAAERESQRQEADARIAALTTAAAERADELDALRAQVAAPSATEPEDGTEPLPERREAVFRTSALRARIASLEMEVHAANQSRKTLQSEAELKINDLLDTIETDKTRQTEIEARLLLAEDALRSQTELTDGAIAEQERQVEEASAKLAEERRLAEAAAAQHQVREAELQAHVEQVMAAGEDAQQQVGLLEQTLAQLRGKLDEVTARLAVRDLEMAQKIDRVDQASLELALEEIERLEQEQAASDAAAVLQQVSLLQRIGMLEKQAVQTDVSMAAAGRELDDERRLRFELEARAEEHAKALDETGAMLEEAKTALARQYDAIREQVQAGTTMRLEDGKTEGDGKDESLVVLSPDLVPLIGQLEAATATALGEVKTLRDKLELERAIFVAAAADKNAKLESVRAEMVEMQQRLKAISEAADARASEMEAAHTAALAAMNETHELRVAGLKGEIDGLKVALAARDRAIGMLESELKSERDSSVRVLAMARETEAALAARIRELETAFALPDTESAAVAIREGASLRDTVFGSILDMIPVDKARAITRFEALPPTSDIPDPVLKAMGNLYREQGNYASACALFEQLAERNPDDVYAERKLVMTMFDMGLYDQALDRLAGSGKGDSPDRE